MNFWFIFSGILSLLLGFMHLFYGEKYVMPYLKKLPINIINSFRINWYQSTFLLFGIGIFFVLWGFKKLQLPGIYFAFPISIIIIQFIIFSIFTISDYRLVFKERIPVFLFFLLLIIVSIIGYKYN